jgi:hypothetical protein
MFSRSTSTITSLPFVAFVLQTVFRKVDMKKIEKKEIKN